MYKESIEIKKIYKHPNYVYPNLYNDIALLELGRRVKYDFDTYGDTPTCLDQVGCGYAPPPILRVGGGVTLLLIYDVHSGREFGRGQNMAARNLKPKGKKTL